ncbi:multidrug resistance efflux transporter family protein [Effusibacillus consociatus]|uniref:Multidrug resistance efflux transporter family protein n=1 Tax=Effusibacillus consociatus TaxID=1117041 RepID=A0ABV9Q837_9BACL
MQAIILGILASLFFAVTFVLNRAMDLQGGSWIWSASLRYFFMVPFLLLIVAVRGNLVPLLQDLRKRPWVWITWSFVGFGLFYAPLCIAAAYGPSWLLAGTWQITIVAGSLLVPFLGQRIPVRGLMMSLIILIGVGFMQAQEAGHVGASELLFGILPILVAAFAYPLGNRKMMDACEGRLDAYQRVLGMTLASMPLWIILSIYALFSVGAPSGGQTVQTLIVAISSGVIATVLFFKATDLVRGNVQKLAAVEATQAGEVIFAVAGELLILSGSVPSAWSVAGMCLVMTGMVLHSYVSHAKEIKLPQQNIGA